VDLGDLEAIARSLEAMNWFAHFRSRRTDYVQMLLRAEAQLPQGPERISNPLWRRITARRYRNQRIGEAKKKEMEKILAAARVDGSQEEVAFDLMVLGAKNYVSDKPAALEYYQESQSIYRRLGDTFWETWLLGAISLVYFDMGKPEKRVELIQQQFEMAQNDGYRLMAADAQGVLGFIAERAGRYMEAERIYQEVLPVFREFRDRWHTSQYVIYLSRLAFLKGNLSRARAWVAEGLTLERQFNMLGTKGEALGALSMILNAEEGYIQAVQACQNISRDENWFYSFGFMRPRGLAYAQCGLGDFPVAREHLRNALETAVSMQAPGWHVQMLPAAALLAASEDRLERAAELLALGYHHPAAATGWQDQFPLITRLRAKLDHTLGPAAFQAAWERGKALDLEETINTLLEELI